MSKNSPIAGNPKLRAAMTKSLSPAAVLERGCLSKITLFVDIVLVAKYDT